MEVEDVTDPRVDGWDHERRPVGNESNVTDQRLVEDGIHDPPVVPCFVLGAFDACAF